MQTIHFVFFSIKREEVNTNAPFLRHFDKFLNSIILSVSINVLVTNYKQLLHSPSDPAVAFSEMGQWLPFNDIWQNPFMFLHPM